MASTYNDSADAGPCTVYAPADGWRMKAASPETSAAAPDQLTPSIQSPLTGLAQEAKTLPLSTIRIESTWASPRFGSFVLIANSTSANSLMPAVQAWENDVPSIMIKHVCASTSTLILTTCVAPAATA